MVDYQQVLDRAVAATLAKHDVSGEARDDDGRWTTSAIRNAAALKTTHRLLVSHHKRTMEKPDPDEDRTLNSYISNDYKRINAMLWRGDSYSPDIDQSTIEQIGHLDRLLSRSVTPEPLVATHQDKWGDLYYLIDDMNVGDEYTNKGYQSTTIGPNLKWGGIATIEYRVPAGTHALYAPAYLDASRESHDAESELLIARGMRWRLVSKKKDKQGHLHAVMALVSQPNSPPPITKPRSIG